MNTKKPYCPFATSKYKGVSYRKQKSVRKNGEVYYRYLWVAHLELGGKEYCKSGKTEIHAAFLYNILSSKYHGEFAFFNTIVSQEKQLSMSM